MRRCGVPHAALAAIALALLGAAPGLAATGVPGATPVAPFPASRSLAPRALPPPVAQPRPAIRRRRVVAHAPGRAGTLRAVPAPHRARRGARRLLVQVEGGLRVERHDFARWVEGTLADRRSWGVPIARVDGGRVDLRVVLARPDTTDRMCAPLVTNGIFSCGTRGAAVLNVRRWQEGASSWEGDLRGYRRYLVNHEVGHLLGHDHVGCPAPGAPAPVMMQQTKGVGACRPNGWPRP
jgi:hypothetical protein